MSDKILPQKLYKYFGNPKYALTALQKKATYMQRSSDFNDPFDNIHKILKLQDNKVYGINKCEAIFKFMMTDRLFIDNYIDYLDLSNFNIDFYNNSYFNSMDIEEAIKAFWRCIGQRPFNPKQNTGRYNPLFLKALNYLLNQKDDIEKIYIKNCSQGNDLISCFSERFDSIPMWAYYGNNHSGLVFEYDTSLLNPDIIKCIFPVNYSDKRNTFEMYKTKSNEWKHECEWRLVDKRNLNDYFTDDKLFCNFDCIIGIYFGVNYNYDETYLKIVDAVRKSERGINLFSMSIDDTEYKLKPEQFYSKE